jgi:hypothetical protein
MMGAVCEKRDRLWASYHEALTAYIVASEEYNPSLDPYRDAATILFKLVMAHGDAIEQHRREHGCDPKYLRALEN